VLLCAFCPTIRVCVNIFNDLIKENEMPKKQKTTEGDMSFDGRLSLIIDKVEVLIDKIINDFAQQPIRSGIKLFVALWFARSCINIFRNRR